MRHLIVFERITPEGYFTDADGNEQTLFVQDPALNDDLMANAPAGTYLFGRRTYERMAAFWPNALADPDLPAAMQKMARKLNEDEKIVFSRTLEHPAWPNTRVFRDLVPAEIQAMRDGEGPDLLVMGSGSIVSALTESGLVDEYLFVLSPRLAGQGAPLFKNVTVRTPLELVDCRAYESGNVLLRYRPTKASPVMGLGG
jgi:dihydrofolate reductase